MTGVVSGATPRVTHYRRAATPCWSPSDRQAGRDRRRGRPGGRDGWKQAQAKALPQRRVKQRHEPEWVGEEQRKGAADFDARWSGIAGWRPSGPNLDG